MEVKELMEKRAKEILSCILDSCYQDNFRGGPMKGSYIFDYGCGQIAINYCDYLELKKWTMGEL